MLSLLHELKQLGVINAADFYFAKLIHEQQKAYDYPSRIQHLAVLLAALMNFHYRQGNTCMSLDEHLEQNLFSLSQGREAESAVLFEKIFTAIEHLPIVQWQTELLQAEHIAFTAKPQSHSAPLVFQFNALYFYRVWQDEFRLAQYLKSAVGFSEIYSEAQCAQIRQILTQYFAPSSQTDWQKIAVATALRQRFCLITGGPGTGKTTTVAKLLLALQQLNQCKLRIKLVAPTGKASARLTESLNNVLAKLLAESPEHHIIKELIASIPKTAETLHRLLGVRYFEDKPQFNCHNPLSLDVLVVDEASMIDLSLMAKLIAALPKNAKLILLGDKDQLSSVEAGAILGELGEFTEQPYSDEFADYLIQTTGEQVEHAPKSNPICNTLCHLRVSHRFHEQSGIGQLARAINTQQAKASWAMLTQGQYADLHLIDLAKVETPPNRVVEIATEHYGRYLQYIQQMEKMDENAVEKIFALFNQLRFLTALRVGELGVEQLNLAIAKHLRQKGLLQFKHEREWYIGKPVMINQNDSNVGLYNGDIGLYLGAGRVWFEQGKSVRAILASRIPSHETAFVMTVHKSQGSEFEHTFLVLPMELNPILTKELVYTGVTRAKNQLTIFSHEQSWRWAVNHATQRRSGLGQLLREE